MAKDVAYGALLQINNGNITNDSGSLPDTDAQNPIGYKGQFGCYTDSETGLVYCQQRYYSPLLGRWLTRDPIGLDGGMNVYEFCGNNPVMGADPSGLDTITPEDLAVLSKLYGQGKYVTLGEINRVCAAMKKAIVAAPTGRRPANLKAALWAVSRLGSHLYDVTAYLGMGAVLEDFGRGLDKCNAFVCNAYYLGAGAPLGISGIPTTVTRRLWSHHTWPPGAKNWALSGRLGGFSAVTSPALGDVIAISEPKLGAHVGLYLDSDILISATPLNGVKLATTSLMYLQHKGGVWGYHRWGP